MITIADLKKEIKKYNYDVLTGSDDSVGTDCIGKANIWIIAKLRKCGVVVDFDDSVVKLAVIKRALYELYAYAENEDIALDKKEDAIELLRAYFGDCIDNKSELAKPLPEIAVQPGSPDWHGFK